MSRWQSLGAEALRRRLGEAKARRRPLFEREDTTCFRLVNGEADGLDGVTVDRFAGVAVVSLYVELTPQEEQRLGLSVKEVFAPQSLYLKRRPREARVVANTQKSELAPEVPLFGPPVEETVALESGLRFLIRPGQGLSVGLYLDMRDTRAWVRREARGRTVLNLFAYTCGFGVAALAGGAERAVNVDLSRRVLDWGEANTRENGFAAAREDFLSGDVFEWLARLNKREQRFSMVILDPPGFSTARGKAFSAASQYARLVEAAAPLVSPGGLLVACCNVAQLPSARFETQIEKGLTAARRHGTVAARLGASAEDFPVTRGDEGALKVRLYALSGR